MAPAAGSMATTNGLPFDKWAPRIPVDNKLSLRIYFRTADSILRQANVYGMEGDKLQRYILLLRYISLLSYTIPQHRHYTSDDRNLIRKKLIEVVSEMEILKPEAIFVASSLQEYRVLPTKSVDRALRNQSSNLTTQFNNLSLQLPTPSAETLARHSFITFAPQKPKEERPLRVQYPSYIDTSPFESFSWSQQQTPTPQLQEIFEGGEKEDSQHLENIPSQDFKQSQFDLVNQLAPPPVATLVETLPVVHSELAAVPQVDLTQPKQLFMSFEIMDEFLEMAKENTRKNIETCGVLAGLLENGQFIVTALIIPKQEATSNTCETVSEEEIFEAQDKLGLFQLGWIHTHPSQSCFMSSVDLHTHYSYQVMLQEAIAIVMAPTDPVKKYGIFRLSDPDGVSTIQDCSKRGFHSHDAPSSSIYESCGHVMLDAQAKFQVIDLR